MTCAVTTRTRGNCPLGVTFNVNLQTPRLAPVTFAPFLVQIFFDAFWTVTVIFEFLGTPTPANRAIVPSVTLRPFLMTRTRETVPGPVSCGTVTAAPTASEP